jgi:hypothetical protein
MRQLIDYDNLYRIFEMHKPNLSQRAKTNVLEFIMRDITTRHNGEPAASRHGRRNFNEVQRSLMKERFANYIVSGNVTRQQVKAALGYNTYLTMSLHGSQTLPPDFVESVYQAVRAYCRTEKRRIKEHSSLTSI